MRRRRGYKPVPVDLEIEKEEEEIKVYKRKRKPKDDVENIAEKKKKVDQPKSSTVNITKVRKIKKNQPEQKIEVLEQTQDVEPERIVDFEFIGDPIPMGEAEKMWPDRYHPSIEQQRKQQLAKRLKKKNSKSKKKKEDEEEEILVVKHHYSKALVDGTLYELNDDAHVKSDNKDIPFICKIIEFFETVEGEYFFRAQWYYRPSDTVVREAVLKKDDDETKDEKNEKKNEDGVEEDEVYDENREDFEENEANVEDNEDDDDEKPKEDHTVHLNLKRIFLSNMKNDNWLDLLLRKINIQRISFNVNPEKKLALIANSDYFYDMSYEMAYKSFVSVPPEARGESSELSPEEGSKDDTFGSKATTEGIVTEIGQSSKSEWSLLDLYCGCGAMSTGLALGAEMGGVNLLTRWAVDMNEYACQTLRLHHPETQVRNESAEDFLSLLKEWKKLCIWFLQGYFPDDIVVLGGEELEDPSPIEESTIRILDNISFGDPKINSQNLKKKPEERIKPSQLFFKVQWKNSVEHSWEPYSRLRNCKDKIREFVKTGYQSKILPLPGDVDVICGGPPCQGVSGYNRFRNGKNPLDDEKNYQMIVYMNIVNFLNPDYILMENVVDLVKFKDGFVGRYAIRRLLSMDYQIRMGMIAAGSFGLPQFRRRVFVWGAKLKKYYFLY